MQVPAPIMCPILCHQDGWWDPCKPPQGFGEAKKLHGQQIGWVAELSGPPGAEKMLTANVPIREWSNSLIWVGVGSSNRPWFDMFNGTCQTFWRRARPNNGMPAIYWLFIRPTPAQSNKYQVETETEPWRSGMDARVDRRNWDSNDSTLRIFFQGCFSPFKRLWVQLRHRNIRWKVEVQGCIVS